jgi:hypothetical protein
VLLRREVLLHELVSREQRAFGVGRHGTESRPQAEREAQGVEGLLRDARARGIAAERERCRRLERVRLRPPMASWRSWESRSKVPRSRVS